MFNKFTPKSEIELALEEATKLENHLLENGLDCIDDYISNLDDDWLETSGDILTIGCNDYMTYKEICEYLKTRTLRPVNVEELREKLN